LVDTVFTDILNNTDDFMPGHVGLAEPFVERGGWCAPKLTGKILGDHDDGSQAVDFCPRDLAARDQPGARGSKETGRDVLE